MRKKLQDLVRLFALNKSLVIEHLIELFSCVHKAHARFLRKLADYGVLVV